MIASIIGAAVAISFIVAVGAAWAEISSNRRKEKTGKR